MRLINPQTDVTTGGSARLSPPYMVLGALTAVYAANLLDRQIINVLAEPIKVDLGLSDTQVGLLSGLAFAVFYTTLGLPMAMLSDRANRVRIIAACCLTWSAFTALCGLGTNFVQLALARVGVAIGEAGGTPPSYSLIMDYFPAGKRAVALSVFTLGAPIGAMAGAFLAGTVGAAHGWRAAFLVASLPGVLFALGVLLLVREPLRGRLDTPTASSAPRVPLLPFVALYWRDPVLRCATIAGSLAAFAFYGSSAWLAPFLMREQGMSMAQIGIWYSLGVGLATATGQLSGGFLADRLSKRISGAMARIPACAFLVGFPFFVLGALAQSWPLALTALLVASAAGILYVGPTAVIIQEAASPQQRSLASAVYLFTANSVGLGLGPLFVGWVSDVTESRTPLGGLPLALLALSPVYILAALAFWVTAQALVKARRSQP
ncbi:MFS transporter [soil metagenome]